MKKIISIFTAVVIIGASLSICAAEYNYDSILNGNLSQFAGTYRNAEGDIITLHPNGTEGKSYLRGEYYAYCQVASGFEKRPDGCYTWGVCFDFYDEENGSYGMWLYPIGVEAFNGYGELIETDTSKVRLYAGHDFYPTYMMPDLIYYPIQSEDIPSFWDVPQSHWAYGNITELAQKGIVSGHEDGSFQPDKAVTRGEWAKLLFAAGNIPVNSYAAHNTYMCGGHWASVYLMSVIDIFPPYPTEEEPLYFPDNPATREDVAASLVRFMGYETEQSDSAYLSNFSDYTDVSWSNRKYVNSAVEHGVLKGYDDNTLRPLAPVSRAEAVSLICRTIMR